MKTNPKEGPEIYQYPNCNDCKHLMSTIGECYKLKRKLSLYTNSHLVKTPDECPYLKQNALEFYESQSKKLKEELSLKLKTEITSIFPDYLEYQDYLHKTVGPNLCASFKISHIDFEQLVKFQRNLPDYGLSFSASTQNIIVVSIYKKPECF